MITSDETWTLAGSPYWIQNTVTVEEGVTLTIDPGVNVKFKKLAPIHLEIKGNLTAIGTPSKSINFTSNASSPASKDWGNIWVYSSGYANIDYINVTYGNIGVFLYYASNCTVKNSTFFNNEEGIQLESAYNNTVFNNIYLENKRGIFIENSENNTLTNNTVTLSSVYGISSLGSVNNKIYHNNFINNSVQAGDNGNGNFWNDSYPSGGNYWSDWSPTTDDLYDGPLTPQTTGSPDGICDNPYDILNGGGSKDYYPLKYPVVPPDDEPPTINDVDATPDLQELNGFVNISTIVEDNEEIGGAWINITAPFGGSLGNFSMNYDITNDRYYYNTTFNLLGTYLFTIWANDTSDNWNSSSGSFLIRDSTPPSISNVASNPNIQEIFGNVNISALITDNYNLSGVWINITGPNGSSTNITMDEVLGNVFYLNQSYAQIGVHDFTIWANDTNGNWGLAFGSFTIEDSLPPWISSVTSNPNPQGIFANVNISATVTDNYDLFGVWVNISFPDGSSLNITMNEASGNEFYFNQSYNQIGLYDFTIWGNDTNDNWNFALGSFTIRDTTPPSISNVVSNPNTQEIFDNVNISTTIMDNYDLYGVWVNITNPDGSSTNTSMTGIPGNVFYLNQSYDQVGIYDFTIWANDTSNNWNFSLGFFTIEDTTLPSINNMASNPGIQEVADYVNISAIISDNYDFFTAWLNITLPDGSSTNITLNEAFGNLFYLNQTYDEIGVYDFIIWANDTSDNWNSTSGSFTIEDTTPPLISNVVSNPNTQEILGNVNVSATIIDNYALNEVWINITHPNGSSINTSMTDIPKNVFYLIQSYDQIGSYNYIIWANDTSNNWNFSLGSFMIMESLPPSITNVASNPSIQEVFGYVNISAIITDNNNLSGAWINITNPDGSSINISLEEGSGNIFYLNKSYAQIGVYDFTIWANDTSNNWNFSLDSFTISDLTPPSISNTASNPGIQEVFGNVNISTTVTDNYDFFDVWINITKPDGSSINSTMNKVLGNDFYLNQSYDQLGVYDYTIWANDTSDNWNFASESFTITDTTPPSISNVVSNPNTQEVFDGVNISAIIMDNYDLFGVWVNITFPDGSSTNTTMNEALDNSFYLDQTYDQVGVFNFIIWVNDTSNNWNFSSGFFTIDDSVPPSISSVVTNPDTQEITLNVNISAVVTDNYDLYRVWVNITDPDGSSINISMDEIPGNVFYLNQSYSQIGNYNFIIWANDTSNNWNYASGSFIVEDMTLPSINDIIANPDIQNPNENVNITATVTENYELTGVWINISIPDGTFINVTMNESFGNIFYLNDSYTQTGIYDFTIWANDTSDNWDSGSGVFTIFDPTIPQAAAEILGSYWKNDGTIAVLWSASDNTGLANITLLYRYSSDNASWVPWTEYGHNDTVSGTSASGTFQFIAPEEGYYEFFVNTSDIDNNWEPDALSAEAIVAVDTSTPYSSISISPYWNTISSLIINTASGDSLPSSGIKNITTYYRYSSDNVSWSSWEVFVGDDREGYYEFYSIACDNAGNFESKSMRGAMCAIDNTPPVAEAGEDRIVDLGDTVDFDGSGSIDNFGIITSYTWSVAKDGSEITVLYGPSPSFDFDDSGEYLITLTILDTTGNIDDDTLVVSVISLDLDPPTINPTTIPTVQEVHGAVNITAEVVDNIGVFGVWIQIFDEDYQEVENASMTRIGSFDDFYYERIYSIVGSYNYTIWANDTSDNWASSHEGFIIRDTTSPTAFTGGDKTTNVSESVHLDGSGSTDNVGIVNYSWSIYRDGILITILYGDSPNYIFDEPGLYESILTVKDAEGNTGDDAFLVTVTSPKKERKTDYTWLIILIVLLIIIFFLIFVMRSRKEEPQKVKSKGPESTETTSELQPLAEEELPPHPPEMDLPPPLKPENKEVSSQNDEGNPTSENS